MTKYTTECTKLQIANCKKFLGVACLIALAFSPHRGLEVNRK